MVQRAIKLQVNVGKDHVVKLPSEFPEGPAEVIVIAANSPFGTTAPLRGQGMDAERYARGELFVADDFDAPLPPEIQRYFEGEGDDLGMTDGGSVRRVAQGAPRAATRDANRRCGPLVSTGRDLDGASGGSRWHEPRGVSGRACAAASRCVHHR